jgi:hypothetical protein
MSNKDFDMRAYIDIINEVNEVDILMEDIINEEWDEMKALKATQDFRMAWQQVKYVGTRNSNLKLAKELYYQFVIGWWGTEMAQAAGVLELDSNEPFNS